MFRIISATLFFTLALGEAYLLQTCESSVGHVVNASVTGCKVRHGKYILKRGTNAGIETNFETEKEVQDIKPVAKVTVSGLDMSFPLPNQNGCKVLKCPLQKGGPYLYTISMPVKRYFPKIEINAIFQLRDENEDVIACVKIPVKVE